MSLKNRLFPRRTRSVGALALLVLGVLVISAGCSLSPGGTGVDQATDKGASLSLYATSSSTAKTGVLMGVVRAQETGYAIRNATVRSGNIRTTTDSYGRYSLKGVSYGLQSITYSADGRTSYTRTYALASQTVTLKTVYLAKTSSSQAPLPAPSPSQPPVVTSPAPNPAPAPSSLTVYEQQMVDLVNRERTSRGLKALQVDMAITGVARQHSQEMIDLNYFSHTSPVSGSPFDRLKSAGIPYSFAGENIAGNQSVEAAHTAFMNSEGHRANILNQNYTHIGIGIKQGGTYGMYFTQMFVGR